jgi:prepilin-type N-terminal cleavage/methylation domain-containing protein
MNFSPSLPTDAPRGGRGGFTLAEVLAALLLMAIVVPVTLGGMSIASRAGILGQRKAAAMRVAERVLDETIATNQLTQSSANGSQTDGDTNYPWTMETVPWTEDTMTQMTVHVTFTVQGRDYQISASTLFDPNANSTTTTTTAATP